MSAAHIVTAIALALAFALASPHAQGAIDIDGDKRGEFTVDPRAVEDARVKVRLVLDEPAIVYAKLLLTSWSPVNNGEPNGTVTPDRASGIDGWWIAFRFATLDGAPLVGTDANATSANDTAFHVVDGTPTPSVLLPGGSAFLLETTIHFPDAALVPGARYEVSWSVAGRPGTSLEANASGASRDPSVAFTQTILVPPGAETFERRVFAPAKARPLEPGAPEEPANVASTAGGLDGNEGGSPPEESTSGETVFGPPGAGPALVAPILREHDSHFWILVLLACVLAVLLMLLGTALAALVFLFARRRASEEDERRRESLADPPRDLR